MSGLRARRDRRPGTAFAGPPQRGLAHRPHGAGSLRIQDTYRVDPNDLRSLPTGVAYIVTGGRAARVAVARGGRAPLVCSPRRGRRGDVVVGPGDPALVRANREAEETEQKMTDVENGAVLGDDPATPAVAGGIDSAPAKAPENDGAVGADTVQTRFRSPYAQGL